jgi:D-arabinose 1-dehydrogenase-like Zn-dependent alcohol dehydrogenase
MTATYKAVEVTSPGKLNLVTRPVPEPGPGQVRMRVEAAGICHSDVATVEAVFPWIRYPRVPGHEIAGYIEALGENVSGWKTGQRVGIGWFGGQCGHCESCRRGDFVNCEKLIISGITTDGGYAEIAIVESRALASIPDGVTPADAAPQLMRRTRWISVPCRLFDQ